MKTRPFGKTSKKISEISMGSTRLKEEWLDSKEGLEKCAQVVVYSAKLGVNYFDIGHNYLKSKCEEIYKLAFKELKRQNISYYSSSKTMSTIDFNAEGAYKRVISALKNMEIEKIDFFYVWSIMSLEEYRSIMGKDGIYNGLLKAKNEGLIDHILFSNHAPVNEAVEIIKDGAFEGITISYNVLNYGAMQPIIDEANKANMGIMVMNPLAGGIIPQNPKFFSNLLNVEKEKIVDYSHAFILAEKSITTVMSGVSSEEEAKRTIEGYYNSGVDLSKIRQTAKSNIKRIKHLCTGCGYCLPCPQNIPIAQYMQAYNMMYLDETSTAYNRTNKELLKNIAVFRRLVLEYNILPPKKESDCIKCKECESKCTQKLSIIKCIEEIYEMANKVGATYEHHKERLNSLIHSKNYKKVGFYTGGGYTAYVIGEYKKYFGNPTFEIFIFESNKDKWGEKLGIYEISPPSLIEEVKPDAIIITSYKFSEEIYKDLAKYKDLGIEIIELHNETDVPWVF